MYVYSLNRIQRPDPKDPKKTEIVPARTVFESSTDKFNELAGLNAARKATGEEIDVYKAQQARLKGEQAPAASTSGKSAESETTDDLTGKTVAELKAVAEDETIDLGDLTKKDDILAEIRAVRATRAAGDGNLLG